MIILFIGNSSSQLSHAFDCDRLVVPYCPLKFLGSLLITLPFSHSPLLWFQSVSASVFLPPYSPCQNFNRVLYDPHSTLSSIEFFFSIGTSVGNLFRCLKNTRTHTQRHKHKHTHAWTRRLKFTSPLHLNYLQPMPIDNDLVLSRCWASDGHWLFTYASANDRYLENNKT